MSFFKLLRWLFRFFVQFERTVPQAVRIIVRLRADIGDPYFYKKNEVALHRLDALSNTWRDENPRYDKDKLINEVASLLTKMSGRGMTDKDLAKVFVIWSHVSRYNEIKEVLASLQYNNVLFSDGWIIALLSTLQTQLPPER